MLRASTADCPGAFPGSLEEVVGDVSHGGELEPCRFIDGWFEDTMPF